MLKTTQKIKPLKIILLFALLFFSYLLLRITLEYLPMRDDISFLLIKTKVLHILHWRIAFFTHVFTSVLVLLAGFTQFSKRLLTSNPKLHRIFGYVYVIDVLFITGPASLVMSFYANGGFYSQMAFVILAMLWLYCTAMAWRKAVVKDFTAHKAFMIRSYALTLSAVTLRLWKYLIVHFIHMPPMDVYRIVAWLGWTLNFAIAEYIIYRGRVNGLR